MHGGTVDVDSVLGAGNDVHRVVCPSGAAHLPETDRVGAQRDVDAVRTAGRAPRPSSKRRCAGCRHETVADRSCRQPSAARDARRARILVADDNADMRDYCRACSAARWTVEAVGDGDGGAGARARRARPTSSSADVMMPGLDGFELLARCARTSDPRDCRSSCSRRAPARRRAIEGSQAGADDYLVKPFSRASCSRASRRSSLAPKLRSVEEAHAREAGQRLRARAGRHRHPAGPEPRVRVRQRTRTLRSHRRTAGSGKPIRDALPELEGQGHLRAARRRLRDPASRIVGRSVRVMLQRRGERSGGDVLRFRLPAALR